MKYPHRFTRREFLRSASATVVGAAIAPSFIPAPVLGAAGTTSAANRVAVGCIGTGDRGQAVMGHFLGQDLCRVVAVCDVKTDRLAQAKGVVDAKYGNKDCATHRDFRELLARKDIDAVLVASTDHWHVPHALAAVRAGKDVYVEKPLGLSLAEDQALRKAVQDHKRMFQFGTQQRSDRKFRVACELVRNGHIGKLKHINIWAPASAPGGSTREVPPPPTIDYDFWLGPARKRPHTEDLTSNAHWWFISDFALGFIAGWGIHPVDIALWGAGDLVRGAVELEGKGRFPASGTHDTATEWDVNLRFANGLTMRFVSTPNGDPDGKFHQEEEWKKKYGQIQSHGTAFEGTEGWVQVDRSRIQVSPENLIDIDPDTFKTRLVQSPDHVRAFLTSVRNRQPTVSPVESAVLGDAFCHISDIAIRLQRKVKYDVDAEQFVDDAQANKRLELRPMRAPWQISSNA